MAMNFVRATGVQGKKIAPEKRIYATLAVCGEALTNTEDLLGCESTDRARNPSRGLLRFGGNGQR
jgi:hypothetical protein